MLHAHHSDGQTDIHFAILNSNHSNAPSCKARKSPEKVKKKLESHWDPMYWKSFQRRRTWAEE